MPRFTVSTCYCLCPSLTRRSEFLSVRYLADAIGHTTAAGTYRIKPVALLNTRKCGTPEACSCTLRCCAHRVLICCCSFFKSYLQQLRHMVKEGFVSEEHVDHIIVESDVTKLLDRVHHHFVWR